MSEALDKWRSGGTYEAVGGRRVFTRRSGAEGEVLLCLHGFPTTSFDYHKIWDALAERFSPVAFDMVGYGFSDKPADFGYTTFDQVDVLQRLISQMGIERLHILSHDYGNTLVQELLARREEGKATFEIASICFLNGALFPETHRPIFAQKLLIGQLGALFGRFIPDAVFKKNLSKVFGPETQPSEAEFDDYVALFKHNGGKRIAHRLIRYMRERQVYRERWVDALHLIDAPFLMINGSADPVSGAHLVERFREVVPEQKNIVELDGVGHFPHVEAPLTVVENLWKLYGTAAA
jgi:pimeloyl-ACP methyl ester carboxylesterase